MVVSAAPDPRDVEWRNIFAPARTVALRRALMGGAFAVLAVLWSIPVTACYSLANLDEMKRLTGWHYLGEVRWRVA